MTLFRSEIYDITFMEVFTSSWNNGQALQYSTLVMDIHCKFNVRNTKTGFIMQPENTENITYR